MRPVVDTSGAIGVAMLALFATSIVVSRPAHLFAATSMFALLTAASCALVR